MSAVTVVFSGLFSGLVAFAALGRFHAAVHPDATDLPDPSYLDANCDGIDGEASNAAFVSTSGSGSVCSMASPCATVQQGIDTASGSGKV